MMSATFTLAALVVLVGEAAADPCAPVVMLDGDEALVATVGAELRSRGIATTGSCDVRAATVQREGENVVVGIENSSRTVRGVGTAATVIESFVRDEVGTPLLAARSAPGASSRSSTMLDDALHAIAAPPSRPHGWHFTATVEGSLANDGSGWGGMSLGACRMIGPLCAGGRIRGSVVTGDDPNDGMFRKASDFLLGLDVPFSIGPFLLMPGVAAGIGGVTTHRRAMEEGSSWYPSSSDNLRAQAHASLSVPLTRSLALDLSFAGTLGQQVARLPGYMDAVPEEPFAFLRFGVGIRYGRR